MSTESAIMHLNAAIKALSLEAYRADDPAEMRPIDHFTIAEDLKRIDVAIGPKGASIFAHIADSIQEAYVEILVAREVLANAPPPPTNMKGGEPTPSRPEASSTTTGALPLSYGSPSEAISDPPSPRQRLVGIDAVYVERNQVVAVCRSCFRPGRKGPEFPAGVRLGTIASISIFRPVKSAGISTTGTQHSLRTCRSMKANGTAMTRPKNTGECALSRPPRLEKERSDYWRRRIDPKRTSLRTILEQLDLHPHHMRRGTRDELDRRHSRRQEPAWPR